MGASYGTLLSGQDTYPPPSWQESTSAGLGETWAVADVYAVALPSADRQLRSFQERRPSSRMGIHEGRTHLDRPCKTLFKREGTPCSSPRAV
jgi:hypothetical protein